MADVLPGYTWAAESSRYRSLSTGRFVARRDILGLVGGQVRGAEGRLANLTTAFHEGRLSGSVWMEQMSTELRRLHLQNSALGAGGWDRLTPRDFGRVGGRLQADYRRLEGFAAAIQNGELTLPQALSRTNLYVGNARVQFWEAERDRLVAAPGMAIVERRVLGDAEHCSDCLGYYDRGWQPVGSLPVPGQQSQCLTYCRCNMLYRTIPAAELGEWLGTKR